jgi:sphingomyelin phosphodiesterase
MVFFTGDLPPHDMWRQTVAGNLAIMDEAMEMMKTYFGDKEVYNLIGNHEPHPLNVFSFPELGNDVPVNTDYVYRAAWDHWKHWMPVGQEDNVLAGGRYSVSPRIGLRIIGINNLFGYMNNW